MTIDKVPNHSSKISETVQNDKRAFTRPREEVSLNSNALDVFFDSSKSIFNFNPANSIIHLAQAPILVISEPDYKKYPILSDLLNSNSDKYERLTSEIYEKLSLKKISDDPSTSTIYFFPPDYIKGLCDAIESHKKVISAYLSGLDNIKHPKDNAHLLVSWILTGGSRSVTGDRRLELPASIAAYKTNSYSPSWTFRSDMEYAFKEHLLSLFLDKNGKLKTKVPALTQDELDKRISSLQKSISGSINRLISKADARTNALFFSTFKPLAIRQLHKELNQLYGEKRSSENLEQITKLRNLINFIELPAEKIIDPEIRKKQEQILVEMIAMLFTHDLKIDFLGFYDLIMYNPIAYKNLHKLKQFSEVRNNDYAAFMSAYDQLKKKT